MNKTLNKVQKKRDEIVEVVLHLGAREIVPSLFLPFKKSRASIVSRPRRGKGAKERERLIYYITHTHTVCNDSIEMRVRRSVA